MIVIHSEIERIEAELGISLDLETRCSFRIHDGQSISNSAQEM
jgi:cell wall assembly regulator SMI1